MCQCIYLCRVFGWVGGEGEGEMWAYLCAVSERVYDGEYVCELVSVPINGRFMGASSL